MRGMDIFQKPYYREISTMRGRPMRGLPVNISEKKYWITESPLLTWVLIVRVSLNTIFSKSQKSC